MEYELYHHGILGMKWGIRRYQNKDGSLTAAGKKRYGQDEDPEIKSLTKQFDSDSDSEKPKNGPKTIREKIASKRAWNALKNYNNDEYNKSTKKYGARNIWIDMPAAGGGGTYAPEKLVKKYGKDAYQRVLEEYYASAKAKSSLRPLTRKEQKLKDTIDRDDQKSLQRSIKLFDKSYSILLKGYKGDAERAYIEAINNYFEATGYFKKSADEIVKKYSKYRESLPERYK